MFQRTLSASPRLFLDIKKQRIVKRSLRGVSFLIEFSNLTYSKISEIETFFEMYLLFIELSHIENFSQNLKINLCPDYIRGRTGRIVFYPARHLPQIVRDCCIFPFLKMLLIIQRKIFKKTDKLFFF